MDSDTKSAKHKLGVPFRIWHPPFCFLIFHPPFARSRQWRSILIALARLQFLAIGENYLLQAHHFRAVLQAIAYNCDLVAGLEGISRPPGPSKIVRTVGFNEPLFSVALIVFRFEMDRGMRIDK